HHETAAAPGRGGMCACGPGRCVRAPARELHEQSLRTGRGCERAPVRALRARPGRDPDLPGTTTRRRCRCLRLAHRRWATRHARRPAGGVASGRARSRLSGGCRRSPHDAARGDPARAGGRRPVAAALFWGAAHALSPGHGKTIVAAYLVGRRGSVRDAAALGLIVTVTHTIGVFALGLVTLLLSQWIVPDRLYPWLNLVAGISVVGIGLAVLRARARDWLHARAHLHGHHHQYQHHDHPEPGGGLRGL